VSAAARQRREADTAHLAATGRPWVHLKAAVTLDGRMATRTGESRWITGPEARRRAHRLRAQSDAVLVGIGTVLADDPALDVREVRGRNPVRVVLDTSLRLPSQSRLLRTSGSESFVILHGAAAPAASRAILAALPGVSLVEVPGAPDGRLDLAAALAALGRRSLRRVLVEGGAGVHGALLDAGLVDEVSVFVAPVLMGDDAAVPLARGRALPQLGDALRLCDVRITRLGVDVLVEGRVPRPALDSTSGRLAAETVRR
jgi:diaminohydroxyphosphoribosylaminopyrimidine deaminase/5-amino-6-(5-phosphoribosylamino)uracil reductase